MAPGGRFDVEGCNDKSGQDDDLITLNVIREQRELDGVSLVDCATYLYTILICLCVHLVTTDLSRRFHHVTRSCDSTYLILSLVSIFRNTHLVHPRITFVLPIYLVILFLVWAADL